MSKFSSTTTVPGLQEQIAIATRDAALKAAGLQAQSILQKSEIQQAGVDFQAQAGEQNKLFLDRFIQNQTQAAARTGRQNLANVRASFAGAGLKLSGSAADVFKDEQRKAQENVQNVNLQGQQQLGQAEQQIQALRLQSSQIGAAAKTDAETVLRNADINTFRFV